MLEQRTILHLDLDTFFVSVERLKDPKLIGLPVIVGGKGGRGVVASCSYETRKFGVHSAMPMGQALRFCPQAIVVGGSMEDYGKYSRMVTDIIRDQAPLFEKSSIDEFYLDLSGMDKYFDTYQWATDLRQRIIRETGLPISWGMAANKMVAKVATGEAKPNGQKMIPPGEEAAFLAPMKISKIPMAGEKTCELLQKMGIEKVWQLAQTSPEKLEQALGVHGRSLWHRANGRDNSPVVPYHDPKSASAERTFYKDTNDVAFLHNLLRALVERVAFQMRKDGQLASCVAVKVRYKDFATVSKQATIPFTSSDHIFAEKAVELFDQLYEKGRLVRLAGVRLSGLTQGGQQIDMFNDKAEDIMLYKALDRIKMRYGSGTVMRASGLGLISNRPEINPFQKRDV